MGITKAFRKLSQGDRKEAKTIMKDLIEQDGLEREDAAKEAINMMIKESDGEREKLIKQMEG